MVVGDEVRETDVLVIGGGPGGYTAALGAAADGRRVTLIEQHSRLGGVCLNVGCIPSKALIHVADIAALRCDASKFGLSADISVDMKRVREWVDGVVEGLSQGIASRLAAAHVTVERGSARFVGPRRCAIDDGTQTYFIEFSKAVIATGSKPVELPVLPFADPRVFDSTDALALTSLPERAVVVGGGYIGLELGTVLAKLGTQVTIVEAQSSLLAGFDPALVRVIRRRLEEIGVDVRCSTQPTGVTEKGILVRSEGLESEVTADCVVVAVGRRPNTTELDASTAGVRLTESGHVVVDSELRASQTIFAVGDVTAGPPLAHRAVAQAEVVAEIIRGRRRTFDPTCIPAVVYTDPEIVTVGLTYAEAKAQGLEPRRATLPMSASGRAGTLGRTDGRVEVVAQVDGTIVGIHLAGVGVSELSGEASLAIEMGATVDDLSLTIHAHPTLSEQLRDTAALLAG